MTLTAWIITLRGRIREALVPELQVLRNRLAGEAAFNNRLCQRIEQAESDARMRKGNAESEARFARIDRIDARRGRFLLAKMHYRLRGPNEGWTLDELYPGDDPASAVDAAIAKERGDE